jgi:hypothetical protein
MRKRARLISVSTLRKVLAVRALIVVSITEYLRMKTLKRLMRITLEMSLEERAMLPIRKTIQASVLLIRNVGLYSSRKSSSQLIQLRQ